MQSWQENHGGAVDEVGNELGPCKFLNTYMFDVYKLIVSIGGRFNTTDTRAAENDFSWAYRVVRPDAVYDTGAPRAYCLNPP